MTGPRLHVLVMPEQFPHTEGDVAGIFVRDYIEAIKPHCDVTVLIPGHEGPAGVKELRSTITGARMLSCTPWLRHGGEHWRRLGRLETLYRLGRAARFLSDVDLIHAHGVIFHGVPASRLGDRLGVPVVLTVHTGPFEKLFRRHTTGWLTRRTLERVDCVCPVSHDLRRQIGNADISPKRVEVTHNPVDTDCFRPGNLDRAPHRRITFAGRLEEYKGGLRVARAFAEIAPRLPGWKLTIAGDGPERQAIEAFVDLHPALEGRVELLGGYTKPEFAELLAASDFFVCPSRHETFGLVVAEAMSAGLPVIAPDRTAPPEFVDQRHGVLVPPDDIQAIATAMEKVARELHRFDRAAIRQNVVDRFGLAAFGENMLDTYRSVLSEHGRESDPTCAA